MAAGIHIARHATTPMLYSGPRGDQSNNDDERDP
jgi:hypothetical protein